MGKINIVFFLVILCLVGCGDDTPLPPLPFPIPTATATISPTPTSTSTPVATPVPTPTLTNPECTGVQRFRGGTLWKPRADHNPNCVMLIRDEFERPFRCEVELKNGNFDVMPYTGKANGDRQHHRCRRPAAQHKRKARIICQDGHQTCEWKLPGSPTKRWE